MPSSHISHKNATNSVLFPDRLKQTNKEKKFEKFAQMFKQIRIYIPFVDAIFQIPFYARFLNDLCQERGKLKIMRQ